MIENQAKLSCEVQRQQGLIVVLVKAEGPGHHLQLRAKTYRLASDIATRLLAHGLSKWSLDVKPKVDAMEVTVWGTRIAGSGVQGTRGQKSLKDDQATIALRIVEAVCREMN